MLVSFLIQKYVILIFFNDLNNLIIWDSKNILMILHFLLCFNFILFNSLSIYLTKILIWQKIELILIIFIIPKLGSYLLILDIKLIYLKLLLIVYWNVLIEVVLENLLILRIVLLGFQILNELSLILVTFI